MTAAVSTPDAQAHDEALSRSQASSKSRSSFRLYFFTFLSVIACGLALANVASAATQSGEDQYVEKAPNGGGDTDVPDTEEVVDTNGDGVISEAEVKQAAEKNKKKDAKNKPGDDSDDGSTDSTGAAAGTTPTPPAASSVATAAKIGPFSKNTALMLAAVALLIGGGAVIFGGAGGGLFGLGSGAASGTPPPQQ